MGKNEGARPRARMASPLENFGVFLEWEKNPSYRLRDKQERCFQRGKSQVTWLRLLCSQAGDSGLPVRY